MNSVLISMIVIVLAARKRMPSPLSGPRLAAVSAGVVMIHVAVIGGLVAVHYWKHY